MQVRALLLRCGSAFTAIGLITIADTGIAQERRQVDERGSVMFGAFVTEPESSARLDSESGAGTDIDLEDDLGLESSKTVARLSGYYWLSVRHRLDFSLFKFGRDASNAIDETIEFGDEIFDIDTVVTTTTDVGIFKAAYTFAPIVRERGDFGITAGLYTASIDLRLRDVQSEANESEGLTAPLPVIGVRGQYAITERITFGGAVEVFSVDAGDANGRWSDAYLGLDYTFNQRIGLGLAYNRVSMDIDAEEAGGFQGQLDWGYDGYLLYLKVNFGY